MACFTEEYSLDSRNVTNVASCLVFDDVWVIQRLDAEAMRMYKFDSELKFWRQIQYKNDFVIPEEFSITSSNGKIYMCRKFRTTADLFEFDTATLEWRQVLVLPNRYFYPKFFVIRNEMYRFGGDCMDIQSLETSEIVTVDLPEPCCNVGNQNNLCELNESIYLVGIRSNGVRSVYQYSDTFTEIDISDVNTHKKCAVNGEAGCSSFTWSSNNNIYHAISYGLGKPLRINSLNLETNTWANLFETNCSIFDFDSTCISGDHNKIYLRCQNQLHDWSFVLRVIDIQPSLTNIILIELADTVMKDPSSTWKNGLPFGLRQRLDDMVEWKLRDRNALKWFHRIETG